MAPKKLYVTPEEYLDLHDRLARAPENGAYAATVDWLRAIGKDPADYAFFGAEIVVVYPAAPRPVVWSRQDFV